MRYQGDLIEATLRSEPIGQSGVTDLLYINYKAPDYTGHIYNMKSEWEGLVLQEVDAQLGRVVATLDELFPNDYALIVTADHGQCPLPDDVDGVRLDPVQLGEEIDRRFGGELVTTVQSVVPSEIYLHEGVLRVNGATIDDVAASASATTGTGRTSGRTCRRARSSRSCSTRASSRRCSPRRTWRRSWTPTCRCSARPRSPTATRTGSRRSPSRVRRDRALEPAPSASSRLASPRTSPNPPGARMSSGASFASATTSPMLAFERDPLARR